MNSNAKFKNGSWLRFQNILTVQLVVLFLCLAPTNIAAQVYTVLHEFDGSDGNHPVGNIVLSNSTLFGTTEYGGVGYDGGQYSGPGVIFKVNTDGSAFAVIKYYPANSSSQGANPQGLQWCGTALYGTTEYSLGTLFKIDPDGGNYTVLRQFGGVYGFDPNGSLLLDGETLYGTTAAGTGTGPGTPNYGTVFKIRTNGTSYTLIKNNFTGTNGCHPLGGLVLSGMTLYGTTYFGGDGYSRSEPWPGGGSGTVFKIDTNGSGFTVLKYFTGSDGSLPMGTLVLSGSTLYGTTRCGGIDGTGEATGYGTIFKINTDGSGYTVLKQFDGNDGSAPFSDLLLSGKKLYGTTFHGGIGFFPHGNESGRGTIFVINTDGSGYTVLKEFSGSDGASPWGRLLLAGSTLYGTTYNGGPGYNVTTNWRTGVVFSLALVPPVISTSPQSQTAELGSTVHLQIQAVGCSTLSYQWFLNGTNVVGTNSSIEICNVQLSSCGAYTVVISNVFGAVTSAPAILNVIPPVERRPVPAINLDGDLGTILHLEYTDVLGFPANWLPLDTVNLSNVAQFYFDITKPLPPQRFYRAWQSETPVVLPSLQLPYFVPAITLTGSIGDTVRVDCINAIGPIDAWVTLDTITLTNTSQLYFDTSGPWNPGRLYRIVPVP